MWKELSFTTDYRISITFDTKLTDAEYRDQCELKERLIRERAKGLPERSKQYASMAAKASHLLNLPKYKSDHLAVSWYSSGDEFFEVRPSEVMEATRKIMKLLEAEFARYDKPVPKE